jgi:hypothetical protein
MFRVDGALGLIFLVLILLQIALKVYVFIDAVRRPQDAFVAADKQTKNFWLIILGLALLTQFVFGGSPIGILTIIGTVAALVYLVDAIPALRAVGGSGGAQRNQGPYGPW